jgi:hypothetical protein
MIVTAEKKWSFGSFLLFAENRFVARRAYAILVQQANRSKRAGTLSLDTGEQVEWMNCSLSHHGRLASHAG